MKNRYVLLADLPLIVIAAFGAFAVRFDWQFYGQRPEFPLFVAAALVIKPAAFLLLGMYRRYWRYASVQELMVVVVAVTAASAVLALGVIGATFGGLIPGGFSRVVYFTDWLLTLTLTGGFRLAIRIASESRLAAGQTDMAGAPKRLLVVGAGAAGTIVAREMRRNRQLGMQPVGYLDDDPMKVGKSIAGIPVIGETSLLAEVVRSHRIDSVVIAMPTAPGRVVRAIVELCHRAGVKSQTIPGIFELLDGHVSVDRLRNIDIEDLLRRAPVDGHERSADFVSGRVVLITGAGGSIGFELARQIAHAVPSRLILLGHGENSIFEAEARLRLDFPHLRLTTVIADVRDERRLTSVFDRWKPSIVFHAAAHKHVPLMEQSPEEAVTNNVLGTRNVVAQTLRTDTERFVLISTDKAVAPTSVMGATKRIAEAIVREAAASSGRAFVTVRFGNVLGSRGSVVHTFKRQIEQGRPITVTHPEMTRFFMTIPEAVHLVLEASGRGKGGELFVLDMGEPVKIVDLARDLIRLSGLGEDDIPVVFSGLRPGEKLHETLFDEGMETRPTWHPDILEVVGDPPKAGMSTQAVVSALAEAARRGDADAIHETMGAFIPGYQPPPVETAAARKVAAPAVGPAAAGSSIPALTSRSSDAGSLVARGRAGIGDRFPAN